jgi:hypothetical protein
MSGVLIAGTVVAAGAAAYAGYSQNKASKKAANQMREGVQTFDPIKPGAPETVDWRRSSLDALNFNLNQQQKQQQFAAFTNRFNTKEAQRMYRTFQPSFDSTQRQLGMNALAYSQGQLPPDVVASLGRAASSRGLQSGFGQGARGGGQGSALGSSLLRGLGLTSLDLSKFGSNLALQAGLQAKQLSPAMFDPSSLAVGPQQAIGYDMQNAAVQNDAARYWNQLQNQALMGNVGAQNQANTNATNTELAGSIAQSQAIQQAGSSLGGAMGTYATNQPQANGGYIPNGGQVPGYNYSQANGYRLS